MSMDERATGSTDVAVNVGDYLISRTSDDSSRTAQRICRRWLTAKDRDVGSEWWKTREAETFECEISTCRPITNDTCERLVARLITILEHV